MDSNAQLAESIVAVCTASRSELVRSMDWSINDHGLYLAGKQSKQRAKVLAIAHLDYLCSGRIHQCNARRIVSSALDDRLGVWFALNVERLLGISVDIIVTDGEETGQSTANLIDPDRLEKYNWIVEFDRMDLDPVVYGFDCMIDPLKQVFNQVGCGSYTDIVELEQTSPVGAYNHGIGYTRQHTESCHVEIADVRRSLENFAAVYAAIGSDRIEHDPIELLFEANAYEDRLDSWEDPDPFLWREEL